MPPRGVKDPKMERMYEHVKESEEKKENRSEDDAERIASATVNKYRAEHGQTKEERSKKSMARPRRRGPRRARSDPRPAKPDQGRPANCRSRLRDSGVAAAFANGPLLCGRD